MSPTWILGPNLTYQISDYVHRCKTKETERLLINRTAESTVGLFSFEFIISPSSLTPSFIAMYEANSGTFYSGNERAGLFGIIFISDSFLPASTTSHPRSESSIEF